MTVAEIRKALEERKDRSAWSKGVTMYALELIEDMEESHVITSRTELLNGASDWNEFSWGGCSLICDCDIAERLCTPSELKKTRNGERKPNKYEEWLDVQARALTNACRVVLNFARR